MISKNEVKYITSLYNKKQRQQEKLFIAEGVKIVDELLNSNYVINKIYATKDWLNKNKNLNTDVIEIEHSYLERISNLPTPNQVLAIVETKEEQQNVDFKNKINLVLDGIQDPGNFGTIIRTANWFGIENIICSQDCVELYNPKVVQSTMGSFTKINVLYKNIEEVLQQNKIPIYGTVLNGTNIKKIDLPKQAFIVIGNEGNGIRENILPLLQHKISIEKVGTAESLNAAVATGIVLTYLT